MLDPRFSSQSRERNLPPSSALQSGLGLNQAISLHQSAESSAGGILGQKAGWEMLLMQESRSGDSYGISSLLSPKISNFLNLWTSAKVLASREEPI